MNKEKNRKKGERMGKDKAIGWKKTNRSEKRKKNIDVLISTQKSSSNHVHHR